jgi:hypothetical protein
MSNTDKDTPAGTNPTAKSRRLYWDTPSTIPAVMSDIKDIPPTVPVKGGLKVIGAGFGRTGTSSLQEALTILGFGPCYHMREVFKDPTGVNKWDAVGVNRMEHNQTPTKQEWDDILEGYQSTVDFPAAIYYQELLEHYPDAKVILTVRDSEGWYKSVSETIAPAHPIWHFIFMITGLHDPVFQRMAFNNIWRPLCGGRSQARNKEILIKAFQDHNAECQATVPPVKLLVFNVKEGWQPLCAFLNCPVPAQDVPFPRSWDTASFQAMITVKRKKAIKRLLLGTAVIVGTVVVTALGMKSKSSRNSSSKRERILVRHMSDPWQ